MKQVWPYGSLQYRSILGIETAKIGGGYRLSLSRVSKLDFLIALRYIYTHPDVTYYGETIDFSNVSRSNGHVLGASLGIGFTF